MAAGSHPLIRRSRCPPPHPRARITSLHALTARGSQTRSSAPQLSCPTSATTAPYSVTAATFSAGTRASLLPPLHRNVHVSATSNPTSLMLSIISCLTYNHTPFLALSTFHLETVGRYHHPPRSRFICHGSTVARHASPCRSTTIVTSLVSISIKRADWGSRKVAHFVDSYLRRLGIELRIGVVVTGIRIQVEL